MQDDNYVPNPLASATMEELDEAEELEQAAIMRDLLRRERRQWKAKARMPMHGKHLLRGQQRQRKRRNEHIREW